MTSEKDINAEEVLEGLVESLEQSLDAERTGTPLPRTRKIERRVVDIPVLRKRYGMTQQQFADAFGISIGTLRGWEQGRRMPDGPAQRLLQIIEDQPEVALMFFPKTKELVDEISSQRIAALSKRLQDLEQRVADERASYQEKRSA